MTEIALSSRTLNTLAIRDQIIDIVNAAVQAVDPSIAVKRSLNLEGTTLGVAGKNYDLEALDRLWVFGFGKAGYTMTSAVVEMLAPWNPRGCIIVKDEYSAAARLEGFVIREASHPIPDQRGVEATREIIELLDQTRADDLVICLVSGGASALVTAPAGEITLPDLQRTTSLLLKSGANIEELNQVRKHLDIVKGGGLARMISPARGITLILSDVVGDPLDSIASGPTVADRSTYSDALAVLRRYNLSDQVPKSVLQHLQKGDDGYFPETAKPDDPSLDRIVNTIIGNNYQAAQAACLAGRAAGFETLLLTSFLQGEARQAGKYFGQILKQIALTGEPVNRPALILAGGETTVTVHGDGLGGRNLEVALSAGMEIANLTNICLVTFATDGGDGPTDAAGAVVTGRTVSEARNAGLDPISFLDKNDSYHFFAELGDLLKPGPTLTNVNDLVFGFAW